VRLVVDAGVIVEACVAGGVLGPLGRHALVAPALLPAEVGAAIRQLVWRGELPLDEGRNAVAALPGLPIDYATPTAVTREAWALAEGLGWAKTYDAEYVALARSLQVPLVTADRRLVRGASHLATILGPADARL